MIHKLAHLLENDPMLTRGKQALLPCDYHFTKGSKQVMGGCLQEKLEPITDGMGLVVGPCT